MFHTVERVLGFAPAGQGDDMMSIGGSRIQGTALISWRGLVLIRE